MCNIQFQVWLSRSPPFPLVRERSATWCGVSHSRTKIWKFCQEETLGGNDKAFLYSSWEVLSMMGRNLQDLLFWCNVPRPLQVQVDGMSAHSALTAVWRWLGSVGIWLMADDCKSHCLMASSSAPHLYSWRPAVSAQTKGTCIGKFTKAHS